MNYKEKLIMGALDDLIPDVEITDPKKPESIKVKAIITEMMSFVDIGEMKAIVGKVSNVVIFSIEKSPEEQEKARQLLAKIKAVIET